MKAALCPKLSDARPTNRLPQLRLVHAIREETVAAELAHGEPAAVALLELGDAGDVDLVDLEAQFLVQPRELGARDLAQVAVSADVQRQPLPQRRQGYRPRMIVASATRFTPRP